MQNKGTKGSKAIDEAFEKGFAVEEGISWKLVVVKASGPPMKTSCTYLENPEAVVRMAKELGGTRVVTVWEGIGGKRFVALVHDGILYYAPLN